MTEPYIIVPVFNGEKYIESFIERVDHKWQNNLIFVNDGSNDNSEEILNNKNLFVVNHKTNQGKGGAIKSAFNIIRRQNGDSVITIDIDLQHPPELLNKFSDIPNKTILLGYRFNRKSMPVLRKFSNFMTSLLISVRSGNVIKDSQCGYRGFKINIFDQITCFENGFHFESELLMKASLAGLKVNHVNIPTIYGSQVSAMNHVSDSLKFIKMWFQSFLWT